MLNALADSYEIVLVSLLAPELLAHGPLPRVPGVQHQLSLPLPSFDPRSPAALIAGLHPLPRSAVATWSRHTARHLGDALARHRVALAIGTDLRSLRYLLALPPNVATILDEPDVSPFLAPGGDGVVRGRDLRPRLREWKYRRLLHGATERLGAVLVASEGEAAAYRALSGSSDAIVLENGVAELPRLPWSPPGAARLLYAGSLTYAPNAEAAIHFAQRILPHIEARVPEVEFVITGSKPANVPPALRHPRIRLTGWLDDAEFEALRRQVRVCVVPLLSGTGTRVKILEAMALGQPVVSTSKGAEGLAVSPGEHILVADDPVAFAAAVSELLNDDSAAEALGNRARALVAERYTSAAIGDRLRTIVHDLLTERSRPPLVDSVPR